MYNARDIVGPARSPHVHLAQTRQHHRAPNRTHTRASDTETVHSMAKFRKFCPGDMHEPRPDVQLKVRDKESKSGSHDLSKSEEDLHRINRLACAWAEQEGKHRNVLRMCARARAPGGARRGERAVRWGRAGVGPRAGAPVSHGVLLVVEHVEDDLRDDALMRSMKVMKISRRTASRPVHL
eukprot:1388277-Prymnesium_polylepis.1